MASKFYAVKSGRTTGIFNTWEECKESVSGYSGAAYKSFRDINDAYEYLGWENSSDICADNNKYCAKAYVDGSYNAKTGMFSYGVVMFIDDEEIHLKGKSGDPALSQMRNVAGEIEGSVAAMRYAVENKIKFLTIYHDYEGISKWCLGEWKTNKPGTIAYKQYFDSIQDKINIKFIKVKGHSGNKYNDMADELAKSEIF